MKILTRFSNSLIISKLIPYNRRSLTTLDLSYSLYNDSKHKNITEGSCPLIVMHGLFGSKFNWNSLCKALNKSTNPTRTIISVDARNHGDSPHSAEHTYELMAEDVVALLKNLNIEKAAVMGHSMGGRAMMYLSLKYPELIEKAIIVDISPVPGIGQNMTDIPRFLNSMRQISIADDRTIHQGRKDVDAHLSSIISTKSLRDFLITNLVKGDDGRFKWRINIDALENNYESAISNFPDVSSLQYKGPTLFIAGGASDYVKKSDLPVIKNLFPKAELIYMEGAGHWLHSEKPAEFLKLVTNFLNV